MEARLLSICAFLALVAAISCKSVTYPGIGHFDSEDFYDKKYRPLTRLFLPKSPEKLSPEFWLYTRGTREKGELIKWNNTDSASKSAFDGSKETKIIVHGFIDNQLFADWMKHLKNMFLDTEDVNVLLVYWPKGNFFPYSQAVVNTRVVGAMVGIQIQVFSRVKGTSPASFHILGHSLGAHIAGYAGKFLGNGVLGRISGLDPAGPFFEGVKEPAARLWPTDAKYVDAIHTDATPLLQAGFGMWETCAHVDIYPNGGKEQPGCDQGHIAAAVFQGISEVARRLVACNHQRAVDFFMASLNTTANRALPKAYHCDSYEDFQAGKCANCGTKGEKCIILGPRTHEYLLEFGVKDAANMEVGQITNGKRFFMITDRREPLLNKHQYILRLHFASQGNKPYTKEASVKINFVADDFDLDGLASSEETFLFNGAKDAKWKSIFKLGQSYAHPGVMNTDLEDLSKIQLEWDHPLLDSLLDVFHLYRLHVDHIEVLALTGRSSTSKNLPQSKKFCHRHGGDGIKRRTSVAFYEC